MNNHSLVTSLLFATAACSGAGPGGSSGPYATLFDAPAAAATPDQIAGVWGGSVDIGSARLDTRFKFEASKLTVATRCTYPDGTVLSAGAAAASRTAETTTDTCLGFVDDKKPTRCGTVDVLETKTDRAGSGERACSVNLRPISTTYSIAGTKMRYEVDGDAIDLVKIGD